MEELILSSSEYLEWGTAHVPYPGEVVSGDESLLVSDPQRALMAVIDGAGHGFAAAAAARTAVEILSNNATRSIAEHFAAVHAGLSVTRGAAISIATLERESGQLVWSGVGDVTGAVIQQDGTRMLVSTAGIVGYGRMNLVRREALRLRYGDLVILATDGVSADFIGHAERIRRGIPRDIAADLIHRFAIGTDDALVSVARFLGRDR